MVETDLADSDDPGQLRNGAGTSRVLNEADTRAFLNPTRKTGAEDSDQTSQTQVRRSTDLDSPTLAAAGAFFGSIWDNASNGVCSLFNGDAGRSLGDRAVRILENGSREQFTGTASQWFGVGANMGKELLGVHAMAEGIAGADLATEELLDTQERIVRFAGGASACAGTVAGAGAMARNALGVQFTRLPGSRFVELCSKKLVGPLTRPVTAALRSAGSRLMQQTGLATALKSPWVRALHTILQTDLGPVARTLAGKVLPANAISAIENTAANAAATAANALRADVSTAAKWIWERITFRKQLGDAFRKRLAPVGTPVPTPIEIVPSFGKSLLAGEGAVGTYDDLIAAGAKGDNITPHHMPSANHMKQHGVAKGDGLCFNMEHPSPGSGGRHRQTLTYGTDADVALSPRDALSLGVRDARRIYQQDGLYGPFIRQQLQEFVHRSKYRFPDLFLKKKGS